MSGTGQSFVDGFNDGLRRGLDLVDPLLARLQKSRSLEMLKMYDDDDDDETLDDDKTQATSPSVETEAHETGGSFLRSALRRLITLLLLIPCIPVFFGFLSLAVFFATVSSPIVLSVCVILLSNQYGRKVISSLRRSLYECYSILRKEIRVRIYSEVAKWCAILGIYGSGNQPTGVSQ
eukprot:TRINITY_DN16910_c0_g1::TRINITY_DN16910_c0_g1_i1::g.29607::m.29607 TRINITY_DN16910_c0_g1::TRINITY_DN16910_c0_g1_i1::g.29607  ORF type:complete len:178 (+),score=11.70 TRINITY_DN16910_c0_g1_i1:126-659(+)